VGESEESKRREQAALLAEEELLGNSNVARLQTESCFEDLDRFVAKVVKFKGKS
jgi:hypothetical protein